MRIICVSDLHGYLPTIPKCDLLIIAGDICPDYSRLVGLEEGCYEQVRWLNTTFREWLEYLPALNVVATLGNHDLFGPRLDVPAGLRWTLLVDEHLLIDPTVPHGCDPSLGSAERPLSIYGTPWSLPFGQGWAYMAHEPEISRYWDRIPENLDFLIVHGPPDKYGDKVTTGQHVGSVSLLDRIKAVKPKFVICGHIHEDNGYFDGLGPKTAIINASQMDEHFAPGNQPMWQIDLGDGLVGISQCKKSL